ncbi:(GlcNAc)2 ABC transporter permease component 2 [Vibrio astriarenae]|nr:(GlcNAc)2 ABC transporter permease component 2 [Vibrio sp. C7]
MIRSQTLALREKEFVKAAEVLGNPLGASFSSRFCQTLSLS